MNNQLLLIELNGHKYFYDMTNQAFLSSDNINDSISFTELKVDKQLLQRLGYDTSLAEIKFITAHLMIKTHALFGIPPKPEEFEFLKSVFPCIPHPRYYTSDN
jgi:hypothetical protein